MEDVIQCDSIEIRDCNIIRLDNICLQPWLQGMIETRMLINLYFNIISLIVNK